MLLPAVAVRAQPAPEPAPQPPVPVISLRAAIAYARAHQPTLQEARARVAVALENAQLPRAEWDPKLGAGAELIVGTENNSTDSYVTGPLDFDIPRVGGTAAYAKTSWAPEPSTLVGVGVRKELYDFGRLSAETAADDLFARAAEEDARTADLDLALYVEESFYAVAGAHAVLRASEAAVQRATEHRDFAKAGVDAKLRPPVDLSRAEADLARFEVDRVRAQGALTTAEAVLAAAIGSPEPAIDAGADDLTYPTPPPLDTAMRDLDQREPSLRAAAFTMRGQHELTRSLEDELRPELAFSAGITGRAGGTSPGNGHSVPAGGGWLPDVPNYDAMLVVNWPFFDRTVSVRAEASRRQERVRAAEVDAERERLRGRAAQMYTDLEIAESALPALQRSVEAATANQAQVDARFRNGLSTAVELADAEALLTNAQIQLAIGQFQLARARARVARVIAEEVP